MRIKEKRAMVTWLLQERNVWSGVRGSHPGVSQSFQSEVNFSRVWWFMSWGPRTEVALPWSQPETADWQLGPRRGGVGVCVQFTVLTPCWSSSSTCTLAPENLVFTRERLSGSLTACWGRKGGSHLIHCDLWAQGHPQSGSVRTWGQKISRQTWASPGPGRVTSPWEPCLMLLSALHQVPWQRPPQSLVLLRFSLTSPSPYVSPCK